MDFGQNFIPRIPARYALNKATMTESVIDIQATGGATITLEAADIKVVPANLKLIVIADKYTDAYNPAAFIDIQIYNADTNFSFLCPLVDTGNGIFTTELELDKIEYTQFTFTIRSWYAVKITSWSLAAPASTSEEMLEELRGELPRLLYDYNKAKFDITQQEVTIALISAYLVKDTTLNGHLQLTYSATEDAQLIIRAKDNDISELFTPIIYDIKRGRGSIGIPHAYFEKKIGYHTFTMTAQVTNGALMIATRAIAYTVDGGHLAQRVQDVGMDVRDIVMRCTVNDTKPSYIYAIGVDDGNVTVKARPYNEIAETAWEPRLSVGEGKGAAITFNGDWAQDENGWRLNTDEDPWVFWVDAEDSLWAQYFDDETTKLQLATDVVDVSVVMGWRNPIEVSQDQGMIAAYVKSDGTAYYRNYCILGPGMKAWDYERSITQFDGVAENIYVFRTNDYRVGIRIQNTEDISTTLLTFRNWAGMAVPAENLISGVKDLEFDVTAIDTYTVHTPSIVPAAPEPPASSTINPDKLRLIPDEKLSTTVRPLRVFVCPPTIPRIPDITGVERLAFTDNKTIRISFNYELACELDALMPHINIVTAAGKLLEIDQLEQSENDLTIKMVEEMRDMDNLMLTYTEVGSYYIAVRVNDTCVIDYGKTVSLSILGRPPEVQENLAVFIDATFTVIDILETKMYEEEHLIAGVSDLTFTVTEVVTEVDTIGVDFKEHITAKISDVTFTVTQTGTISI